MHFSSIKNYLRLTKPRLMFLVIFTGIIYGTFCEELIFSIKNLKFYDDIVTKYLFSIASLLLGCGACGAINMAMEAKIDQKMSRTKNRPTATEVIKVKNAYIFGYILGFLSLAIGVLFINLKFSFLMLISILFYVPIYTKLKLYNMNLAIIAGNISGSMPAVIISAGIDSQISNISLALAAINAFWTMAHSYTLNIWLQPEYTAANISILTDKISKNTLLQLIILFSTLTGIMASTFAWIYYSFKFLNFILLIINLKFVYQSYQLSKKQITPVKFFLSSIIYLFSIYMIFGFLNIFLAVANFFEFF